MKKIIGLLLVMVLLCGCSIANDITKEDTMSAKEQWTKESIADDISALEELGIVTQTIEERDALLARMIGYKNSFPDEDILESLDPITTILTELGMRNYADTENDSSSTVYAFDTEVGDIGQMYTLFLQGITSINQNEFVISDITEDQSQVDWEAGTGNIVVQFQYNGQPCQFQTEMYHDWFDAKAISQMNQILAEQGNPKRLYFMTDGYQECIIFYQTPAWAKQFAERTGRTVYDNAK